MITGNFKGFFFFSLITVVHECGHIFTAIYYKWKIEEVILLPFGALTIFHEKINKPLKEEFMILIMGPLIQLLFVFLFFGNSVDIINYSNLILMFNMLPIYPLDGSKLLNIILNKITSFKKSHLITIYMSLFTIVFLLLKTSFNLILILILLFVFVKVFEEYKNHDNIFNKFLLERYNSNFNFKKEKIIKGEKLQKMKRDYRHIFYNNHKYITEREMLKKRFDFKRKL